MYRQGKYVIIRTHQDIIEIASELGQDQLRETVRDGLETLFTTVEMLQDEDYVRLSTLAPTSQQGPETRGFGRTTQTPKTSCGSVLPQSRK
jgi:hypothetical protein